MGKAEIQKSGMALKSLKDPSAILTRNDTARKRKLVQ